MGCPQLFHTIPPFPFFPTPHLKKRKLQSSSFWTQNLAEERKKIVSQIFSNRKHNFSPHPPQQSFCKTSKKAVIWYKPVFCDIRISTQPLSITKFFSPQFFFLRLLPIGGVMDTCEQNQKTWAFLSLFVLTLFQVLLCSTCRHYTFMMSKYDDKKSELYKTICIQQDRCILIAAWFVVLHWDYLLFLGVSNHWWKWFREWSIRFIQQQKYDN